MPAALKISKIALFAMLVPRAPPYEFNESDYSICHDLVIVFLDEYPDETPSMNLNCPFGTCVFFSIISGACFHFNTKKIITQVRCDAVPHCRS
mmetsp:Transcript_10417/g.27705  ORF Transcript_10417/g.27705 Transcript_10417/m.27705 type:complete len:93 (-) Transcript_10417:1456-1734(-)